MEQKEKEIEKALKKKEEEDLLRAIQMAEDRKLAEKFAEAGIGVPRNF